MAKPHALSAKSIIHVSNSLTTGKLAREAAPASCRVKQTVTGPHVLTRFSVNQRPDLYPDEQTLCRAYAKVLADELREVIAAGCDYIQFDEPMWTESPEDICWSAGILNELIDSLPRALGRIDSEHSSNSCSA